MGAAKIVERTGASRFVGHHQVCVERRHREGVKRVDAKERVPSASAGA